MLGGDPAPFLSHRGLLGRLSCLAGLRGVFTVPAGWNEFRAWSLSIDLEARIRRELQGWCPVLPLLLM